MKSLLVWGIVIVVVLIVIGLPWQLTLPAYVIFSLVVLLAPSKR